MGKPRKLSYRKTNWATLVVTGLFPCTVTEVKIMFDVSVMYEECDMNS